MRGYRLAAVMVAAATLAGCAGQVDTSKVTYPRTTVPAGQRPATETGTTESGPARTNDPAFTVEKLRAVDVCALFDKDVLEDIGKPEENLRNGFSECANYMQDDAGKDLNLTLTVGDTISNAADADGNVGGLPALENTLDGSNACFVSVVTSTSPNFGMTIQANGGAEDLCGAARTLMTHVVDTIRTDAPQYDLATGTLIDLDVCTLLKPEQLKNPLGDDIDSAPYNIHWCNWSSPAANLGLWLRLGYDPSLGGGSGSKVDLGGGVTGFQEKTVSAGGSCRLEWKHRPFSGDNVEIVTINLDITAVKEGEDPCVPAQAIAKTVIAALPST